MSSAKGSGPKAFASVVILWMLTGLSANAQATRTPTLINLSQEAEAHGKICLSIAISRGTITVGKGKRRIDIMLMGGACEPPGSAISMLSARYPEDDSTNDTVLAADCPAYQMKVNELWSAKTRRVPQRAMRHPVKAGPFTIVDTHDLFDLRSNEGRKAAEQWIHSTLIAVRPCWNTFRQDQSRAVVDDLYGRSSMRVRKDRTALQQD